mmetsp:Transcript_31234/g.50183  ORF Transcript_31234/g.50183 Transcript_31234/m.50183 type:complete len:218 (-) Transcript_31234:452-1105(-)
MTALKVDEKNCLPPRVWHWQGLAPQLPCGKYYMLTHRVVAILALIICMLRCHCFECAPAGFDEPSRMTSPELVDIDCSLVRYDRICSIIDLFICEIEAKNQRRACDAPCGKMRTPFYWRHLPNTNWILVGHLENIRVGPTSRSRQRVLQSQEWLHELQVVHGTVELRSDINGDSIRVEIAVHYICNGSWNPTRLLCWSVCSFPSKWPIISTIFKFYH